MSSLRYYFYAVDADGVLQECTKHPLNGGTMVSGGAFIIRNGKAMRNTKWELGISRGRTERKVTSADFGGNPVLVKHWYPGLDGKGYAEYFWLIPLEAGDIEACNYQGSFNALPQVQYAPEGYHGWNPAGTKGIF